MREKEKDVRWGPRERNGYSLLELLVVAALVTILSAIAVPSILGAVEEARTSAAAHYLAGRVRFARAEAVKRSADVALRFERRDGSYSFSMYVDANRNGVRSLEIRQGLDRSISHIERLEDHFTGVTFGLLGNVPPIDGSEATIGSDPIRLGRSDILTLTPAGTATSGTLYICGKGRRQYAVRVLGATGRTRVMRFDSSLRRWAGP